MHDDRGRVRTLSLRAGIALLVAAVLSATPLGASAASTKSRLAAARKRLSVLEGHIAGERKQLAQQEKAVREVKASLLLGKIAERESINATRDEVDREVERIAKQQREPVAAVKFRMEKDGSLNRIASHIQTEKTLNFLFEHARKEAAESA